MSARIEVAHCRECGLAISHLVGDPWRHNVQPTYDHQPIPDRKTIRDLMAGPLGGRR